MATDHQADLAAIARKHVPDPRHRFCRHCGQDWPCAVARVCLSPAYQR